MKLKSQIKVLGSGSSGNCLAVYDSRGRFILVDVGLKYKALLNGIGYDIKALDTILCSHDHSDHSKALNGFIRSGIPCYGNADVCEKHKGCQLMQQGKALKINGWKFQTFELVHNIENNAFIIDTFDGIRILYCTDTKYIPFRVKDVNYAIIECNSDEDYMIDNMVNGVFSASHPENHQNINDCISYLKAIYNPNLQYIILWHMSDTNICEVDAVQRVKDELSFKNVIAANKNQTIELKKEEF